MKPEATAAAADATPPIVRELVTTGLVAAATLVVALTVFYGIGIVTGTELFFTHDIAGSDFWMLNYQIGRAHV